MTKKITLVSLTLLFSLFISFDAITRSSGAPAGRTGSPASVGTCAAAGCHSGPSVTSETLTLSTDIPASGFVENTDYNITVTADDGGRNLTRIGFSASVESTTGSEGTLSVSGTDIQTTGGGDFVTHTSSGIVVSGGSRSWSFVWNSGTAPDQTTIYVAANFANSNGSTSGDVITTAQLALGKDMGVSIAEADLNPVSAYPNPASVYFQLSGIDKLEGQLRIFDLKGRLVKTISRDELSDKVGLDEFENGVYILTDEAGYTEYLHVMR